jgi:hypothetical protein
MGAMIPPIWLGPMVTDGTHTKERLAAGWHCGANACTNDRERRRKPHAPCWRLSPTRLPPILHYSANSLVCKASTWLLAAKQRRMRGGISHAICHLSTWTIRCVDDLIPHRRRRGLPTTPVGVGANARLVHTDVPIWDSSGTIPSRAIRGEPAQKIRKISQ